MHAAYERSGSLRDELRPVSSHRPRTLLIDPAASASQQRLDPALGAAGYDAVSADTGRKGLAVIEREPPDAVVLDWRLPDCVEVLRKAREVYGGPIIVLSRRRCDAESVAALEAGADDYVERPFRVGELLGRLRVSLQRRLARRPARPDVVHAEGVTIDLKRRLVTRGGEPIHLSPKEYELLAVLAEADGRVLTHGELLAMIRGRGHGDDHPYLRVMVGQLRQRIEVDPSSPRLVLTEPGVGYRFLTDGAARPV